MGGGQPLLLVVDDEPDIRESLAQWLAFELGDVEIMEASSAEEAEKAMASREVDLVLCDFRMPGEDGISFLARASVFAPATSRLLMTAFADQGVALRAINEARVERFLRKPPDLAEFAGAVRDALASRKRRVAQARDVARAFGRGGDG